MQRQHDDSTIVTGNNEHTVPFLNTSPHITPVEVSLQTTYLEDEIAHTPQTIPFLASKQNNTHSTETAYLEDEDKVEYNQLSSPLLNNTQNITFSKIELPNIKLFVLILKASLNQSFLLTSFNLDKEYLRGVGEDGTNIANIKGLDKTAANS